MGYAVRTHGWTLLQWTADARRGPRANAERAACERHADLFRIEHDNATQGRGGRQREVLVAAEHPYVRERLRRRLAKVLKLPPISGGKQLSA